MNWRNDNQDYTIEFKNLNVGETFFFDNEPYLKVSAFEAFKIETDCLCDFEESDPIEPCTHELILRI